MGFELVKVEYKIVVRKEYKESDAPHCGMTLVVPKGSDEYGPFGSRKVVEKELGELEKRLRDEGWNKIERGGKEQLEFYNNEGIHAYVGIAREELEQIPISERNAKKLLRE